MPCWNLWLFAFYERKFPFSSPAFCLKIINSRQRFNRHLHSPVWYQKTAKRQTRKTPQRGKVLRAKFYRFQCEKDFLIRHKKFSVPFNFSHCLLINSLKLVCCLVLQFFQDFHIFSPSAGERIYWFFFCLCRWESPILMVSATSQFRVHFVHK